MSLEKTMTDNSPLLKIATISCTALLLAGCTLAPSYERPAVDTAQQWSAGPSADAAIAADWWKNFGSTELDRLMMRALAQNNDLLAGMQRVEQSRAALKIAGADLLPSARASAGASRTRTNPAEGKTTSNSNINAGLDISYELDLFGANRAAAAGAAANLAGAQYDQDALALVVMGDVAVNYFTLLDLRERVAIADSNLENAEEVLRIVRARVREGVESDLELAQQEGSVAGNRAARESIRAQIENTENALAVLLGQAPQTLEVAQTGLGNLTIPDIAAGQPATLLARRPDIAAAEQSLIAANANIGAARAAFFPSLSISLGQSLSLPALGDPATTALSLASSLGAPLFEGGRLEGGAEQATARQKELVETYRKTVLTAFQEVEDALTAVHAADMRASELRTAMTQARKAYDIAQKRYDVGTIDFQTLLDTQNALLSAEDNYAQARLARLQAAVTLYKALGGGWSENAAAAP
jgi:NodT family efflux transporter outer membrane factor (OMF) lipoprotein